MSPADHGPDERFRKHEQDEHAGNETVNDGPRRPADAAADDELELRRLMRLAVAEIAPSDEALDHLRRAVPARRARKRQAVVGAVAAGVFVAMAVPAVLHVANSGSSDRPSIAGHSEATHGGTGAGKSDGSGGKDSGGSPSHAEDKGKDGKKDKDKGGKEKGAGGGATGGPGPASTAAANSPVCNAADLSRAVATVGQPDASGTVYGSFRVSNGSAANCTVDSPGSVVTLAEGAADPSRVSVVDHTAGDRATGLPDPSAEQSQLILEPGMAYEVRFAWVPSGNCPAAGGTGGGTGGNGGTVTPAPTPSGDNTGSSPDAGTTDSGLSAQLGSEDTVDGSVVVSHTPEPGAPSAAATIPDACAGTVYRTGVLPAS
ncbi:hypothetical protein OKJ48_25685 [Streptomyces kunmingensis]|uniref:DUF4232 domain-containing protein n=1 Tax=Streptomyces kunmingensis TaxID=68225 RepID=A0ABU6CHD6_9ACTN|nr:hypothetical protein [Streptomyces kunmingensis]MEB3963606.1 hypothetical protein [Streptomyces kunmingensis]